MDPCPAGIAWSRAAVSQRTARRAGACAVCGKVMLAGLGPMVVLAICCHRPTGWLPTCALGPAAAREAEKNWGSPAAGALHAPQPGHVFTILGGDLLTANVEQTFEGHRPLDMLQQGSRVWVTQVHRQSAQRAWRRESSYENKVR